MGEVYRARDSRLGRVVAIKVLLEHLSLRAELRERFEREARVISRLNHPHICPLYDVGHQGDVDFLVMEHLEGETLADQLRRGPLPLDQILRCAIAVSSALDHAHRHGVVHRDLKPGNIMMTRTGVRVLDFGLAKVESVELATGVTTPTRALTEEGAILGTLPYMAPEQLECKQADARTDIFALGAVLYEMATGRRAFEGKSRASLIASILEHEPPLLSVVVPMTPAALDRTVKKCLAKNPDDRWQTARDLESELQWISETRLESVRPPIPRRSWFAWSVAALSLVLLVVLYTRRPPTDQPPIQLSLLPPDDSTFGQFALSPDGRRLVFIANQMGKTVLWVRSLDSLVPHLLPDTEGAAFPFWSPDSRYVGFFADGRLKVTDIVVGRARALANAPSGRGGTWNRNGVIVFAPDLATNLKSVSASGGESSPVTTLDASRGENSHRFPWFLPDGRHFIYYARCRQAEDTGIYTTALGSKEIKRLVIADSAGQITSTGYLLFIREPMLMAQRFRADGLEVVGDPFVAAEQVWQHGYPGVTPFSVSGNDILLYRRASVASAQLQWLSREGKALEPIGAPAESGEFSLAPDERHLAMARFDARAADIWLMDMSRGAISRFTSDPMTEWFPVWSPDGSRIVFASDRDGQMDLYQKRVAVDAKEELILKTREWKLPTDWSSDGRSIAYHTVHPETKGDVWVLPLGGDPEPVPVVRTAFDEFDGAFSPDGKWIGYTSDETGRMEVYIQELSRPNTQAGASRWQVSTNGGSMLRWRGDGKEVFYVAPDGALISVPLKTERTVVVGAPNRLFDTPIASPTSITATVGYAVAHDGRRFLMEVPLRERSPAPIEVVFNWSAALKR
jgi:eukaryotic-like serine/threonine-protein kinase